MDICAAEMKSIVGCVPLVEGGTDARHNDGGGGGGGGSGRG